MVNRQGMRIGSSLLSTSTSTGRSVASSSNGWILLGARRNSHVGSEPLYVTPSTTLTVKEFPPMSNPTRPSARGFQKARCITVEGPKGQVIVPLYDFVQLNWQAPKKPVAGAKVDADAPRVLNIAVKDSSVKAQRSTWGLTRALLANAIEGVQDGHVETLRLVGVGYRAALEADPFPRPDKFETHFAAIAEKLATGVASSRASLGNFVSVAQRDFYANLTGCSVEAGGAILSPEAAGKQRLTLRLGYSQPIHLAVPRGITCTVPQPTRIVLKGADKEAIGLFAAQIRRWRPPEPYKGKGVFVGEETIKLKATRKK